VAAADALSRFKGARRRFTQVGTVNGITVVDDYGHHPTEIAATLEAASSLGFKRVVEVFQPHRYTRTRDLAQEFGRCFERADKLVVMDVFSAGDEPIPGVSGKTVVNAVREHGAPLDVSYVPDRHQLLDYLCAECREGDLLITQGAGDITAIGPAFIKQLEAEEA
jgi:UDP-N-acetylmuramate--alanine ligase